MKEGIYFPFFFLFPPFHVDFCFFFPPANDASRAFLAYAEGKDTFTARQGPLVQSHQRKQKDDEDDVPEAKDAPRARCISVRARRRRRSSRRSTKGARRRRRGAPRAASGEGKSFCQRFCSRAFVWEEGSLSKKKGKWMRRKEMTTSTAADMPPRLDFFFRKNGADNTVFPFFYKKIYTGRVHRPGPWGRSREKDQGRSSRASPG